MLGSSALPAYRGNDTSLGVGEYLFAIMAVCQKETVPINAGDYTRQQKYKSSNATKIYKI